MLRLLLPLAILCAAAQAQFSNTIIQTLTSDSTAAMPYAATVRNIGQAFHQVFVVIEDRPGETCSEPGTLGSSVGIALYGSYTPFDTVLNSQFVQLPATRISSGGYFIAIQAVGPWPYLTAYVNFVNVDDCQYSVYYAGAVNASSLPAPPTVLTGATVSGPGTFSVSVSQYTEIYVRGLWLANESASQTVTLGCEVSGATFPIYALAAGAIVSLPQVTQGAYFTCPAGENLTYTLSGAGDVNIRLALSFN